MGRNLGPLNIKDSYEGLVQISGSQLTDGSGSLIPSLDVTASLATSASYASTATSASHAVQADNATTATSATSASYASTATSASYAVDASTATSASHALVSDFATSATSASYANTSTLALSASHAVTSDTATSSSYASNASTADSATSASYALTASYAENAITPDLQQVLDAGNVATGSIELYNTTDDESLKLESHSNGGAVLSGRTNSILNLGVSQSGQFDLITLGANSSVGFYGNASNNFNNAYSWFKTKGWISGSLAVQQAFTASGLIYPTTDGTSGQVIATDGLGNLSFVTAGGGGGNAGLISGSAPNSLLSANYTTTDALAEGSGSIAIGDNSQVTGSTSENTIVIGKDADSKENSVRNVIIGYNAYMTEANRNDSVIIGANANGYQEGVAIGANSFTIYQAVAVGKGAYTNDNYGVAIGAGARTNNAGGIAIGSGSVQNGDYSIAIGYGASAAAFGDVVINNGYGNVFSYDQSTGDTNLFTAVAATVTTSNLVVSGSGSITGPLAIQGIADVSASIAAAGGGGAAFPFVGDAEITGSLDIDGWFKADHLGISGSDLRNLAIGTGSLANVTSGIRNTAIGSYYLDNPGSNLFAAGYQITTGNDNAFYGVGAGTRNTGGSNNTFMGVLAGGGTTTGNENAGFGQGALRDNNGSGNIGMGKWAGYGAAGQNGVMLGYKTGFGNSGWRNIIIGANAVGQGASLTTHDKLVIGQDLTPTDNLIYGYHGADTTPGDRFLTVKGLINAGQYSSAPTGAGVQAGSIYYDTTTNKLRCYNGSTWNDLF